MDLLIQIITLIRAVSDPIQYYIAPQDFLIAYFTILTLIVTLIGITSTLTKEVRYNLIKRYIFSNPHTVLYVVFVIFSFLCTVTLYYLNAPYLNPVILILFIIMFLSSCLYCAWFIWNLNRTWLYSCISENFKNELKKGVYTQNELDTGSESLSDLVNNIAYVQNNNGDFEEELRVVRQIAEECIKANEINGLKRLFSALISNVGNDNLLKGLTDLISDLQFEYYQNLEAMVFLQDICYSLFLTRIAKAKEFDPDLDYAGEYLKRFLDIRLISVFKKTTDSRTIQLYENLVSNSIDCLGNLCNAIIDLDMAQEVKKKYLLGQLRSLNLLLSDYREEISDDFFAEDVEEYNKFNILKNINDKTQEDELFLRSIERKVGLINQKMNDIKEKKAQLFFRILYGIDQGSLSKGFFDVAMKMFGTHGFKERYYLQKEIDGMTFVLYDSFEGGVQSLPEFPYNKYRLIASFYQYLHGEGLDIDKFTKEDFVRSPQLSAAIPEITPEFVSKYFDFDKNRFKKFKETIASEIKKRIESIEKEEIQYITQSNLNREYTDEFNKRFMDNWRMGQKMLSEFIGIRQVEGGSEIKHFFIKNWLFDKKWFIKPFYPNQSIDTGFGSSFGYDYARSKRMYILSQIDLDKGPQQKKVTTELYSDLLEIIKPDREYILLVGRNLSRSLYSLPNLVWIRSPFEFFVASTEINNSTIRIAHSNFDDSLLFEKGTFWLEQYSQGYETTDQPLVIQIENLTAQDVAQLKEKTKIRTPNEIKQKVKARITEKFTINRDKSKTLIRLVSPSE